MTPVENSAVSDLGLQYLHMSSQRDAKLMWVKVKGSYYVLFECPLYSCTSRLIKIEPVHEISNNVVCATSKASDQPAHTRSLIRVFANRLSIL